MAFVDNEQEVFREIVEQGKRRLSRLTAIDVHGVVLDAVAITHLLNHLKVVLGSHTKSLRFEKFSLALKQRQLLLQLIFNTANSFTQSVVTGHIVSSGKNQQLRGFGECFTSERIDHGDSVDGVAEHFNTNNILFVGGMHLNGVAAHSEITAPKGHVVAVVLEIYQPPQHAALVVIDTYMNFKQLAFVLVRVTHTVNARNTRNHNGVAPREQGGSCRVTKSINLFVD